jgi:hypothetical protein
MKNTEWGAVAYLTNAIGRIPYINNTYSSTKTGYAGSSQDSPYTSPSSTYAWNTTNGVKGSTTHNVYGIYDMSGGMNEFVSAYFTKSSYANYLLDVDDKYVDKYYSYDSGGTRMKLSEKYGDALGETSGGHIDSETTGYGWDSDLSNAPSNANAYIVRGGDYNNAARAGIYAFYNNNGANTNDYSNCFRVVLAIPEISQ